MQRINVVRLIVGGLVAGVVMGAVDWLIYGRLMAQEVDDMVRRLNLSSDVVAASTTAWMAVDLILGLLLVFTYVGIRPRFGPGPATAAIAGGVIWLAVTLVLGGYMMMGVFTNVAFVKGSGLFLGSALAASLAGGAVYRE
jgi:hypothetical protein